ncbi:hypothetical protein FQR65_LT02752 [Abscondita terminalis]|nr:hypothetical protein FQR65_LT02752 [Abscondita terminalis]
MSAEDYNSSYYYNNRDREEYSEASPQTWNSWNTDPRYMQAYLRNTEQNYENRPPPNYPYHANANYPPMHGNWFPPYHNPNERQFYGNRYYNPYYQYGANQPPPPPLLNRRWLRSQAYKRSRQEDGEGGDSAPKSSKKKKKPLSQTVPTKREWTTEEAIIALETEKTYNKKSKNSLIIKFPDHELNKEIVSQFHPAIENVHFQQPCTPRFCFVMLRESADPTEIISVLNKQKFGDGLLTVEYKKDRDEEQVVLPDDIDPLTLYVGNLSQEVTKDDIVDMFPNNKRIDIGFAKKMKYTRYAFIAFRAASECLEAFKNTHSKQLYSKSLIVRFRRLHGTIGMPGEPKLQNPPKNKDDAVESSTNVNSTKSTTDSAAPDVIIDGDSSSFRTDTPVNEVPTSSAVRVKLERLNSLSSDDDMDYKSSYKEDMEREHPWNHRPKVKKESKFNIKNEFDPSTRGTFSIDKFKSETNSDAVSVKPEPIHSDDDDLDISNLYHDNDQVEDDQEEEVDVFADMMDFNRIYESMMNHKHKISMLKQSNHSK